MPRQDLLLAIDALAQEKQIDREIVIESLEAAIAKIAKHKYGEEFNITAEIDRRNGAIYVKRLFTVIDSPESVGEEYDANTMSGNPDATLGSTNIAKLFVLLLFKKL